MIEQVLVKTTLQAGDKIWVEGALINAPIPEVLLEEIRLETGTVEVVGKSPNSSKLVFVAQRVEEKAGPDVTTLTSMSTPVKPKRPAKVMKPKPLLKRRKK